MDLRYSIDWIRHAVRLGAEDLLTGTELNLAAFEMSTAPMIFKDGRGLVDFSAVTDASARTDDMVFFLISLNKLVCSRVAVVVPARMTPDLIAEAIRAVGLRHIRSFLGEAEALEWLNEGVAADRLLAANPKPAQSISEAIE
ncbi:MAG: hypothetical protein IT364_00385 [Candidatus Hydrogenedentes bacterium]|nr:hypothetical protein [Candidatus Hydrogenedentota bacterium]